MRIRVTVTLEVDPAVWGELYDFGTAGEIRKDVRAYVLSDLQSCAAADAGAIKDVTLS
jgi:hypothetical protein